uniref:PRORP domain-containing protein n=1 Tax=Rhizophora mucronata TaxID=61149 RepID=A0A2P2QL61_RHIMU
MDDPVNKALIEKWRKADALYATPTGSNDDWYWLYAAIKFKCLIVTNDEMRDHTFQLLGNDFFPKWKERHQVHFSITDTGPVFHMPLPYSVVIQESEKGSWHIPIAENEHEVGRTWLCITRANSGGTRQDNTSSRLEGNRQGRSTMPSAFKIKAEDSKYGNHKGTKNSPQEDYKNLINILTASGFQYHRTVLLEIEAAEKLGDCVIDFQI